MPDPPSPRYAANTAVLAGVNWDALRKSLVRFALSLCHDRAMADDIAQEAVRRLLAAATTWDRGTEADPTRFAMAAVKSILWGERTSDFARKTVPLDASGKDEPPDESLHPADPRAPTEDRIADVDLFARCLAFARNSLTNADDPEALEMLELTVNGYDTPAEICEKTRRPPEAMNAVLAARKRMHRAVEAAKRAVLGEPPSTHDVEDDADEDSTEVA